MTLGTQIGEKRLVLTFGEDFSYNLTMPCSAKVVFCLFAAGVALTSAGCSRTAVPASLPPQTSAGITASLTTTPLPAHTGDDTMVITLRDAQTSLPVGDANVTCSAEAQSPHLPGQAVSGRAQGNGVYNAPVTLPVASPYHIQVKAERPGHPTAAFMFPVDVPN